MENLELKDFYCKKRVLVTGHTGFKGSWLCRILQILGAEVYGYALEPQAESLFNICELKKSVRSVIGDIRNRTGLQNVFYSARPDIVFHLAAQPLVKEGYLDPVKTYETNVLGTVNVLECARVCGVKSVLNVTTDKVYAQSGGTWPYRETDLLDGFDPYSSSKSCSELITACYRRSYFDGGGAAVSTVRAGNVIGGGDFAADRLLPDCIRAAAANSPAVLRNPDAVRPYQHVLEPLFAYLTVAMRQYGRPEKSGCYNAGPGADGCVSNRELADIFCKCWGEGARWLASGSKGGFHEAEVLRLDSSKILKEHGWKPNLSVKDAVKMTVSFAKAHCGGKNARAVMTGQIRRYIKKYVDGGGKIV